VFDWPTNSLYLNSIESLSLMTKSWLKILDCTTITKCSSTVAATFGELSITSAVARKLLGASFSLVRKCAGKPLLYKLIEAIIQVWYRDSNEKKCQKHRLHAKASTGSAEKQSMSCQLLKLEFCEVQYLIISIRIEASFASLANYNLQKTVLHKLITIYRRL